MKLQQKCAASASLLSFMVNNEILPPRIGNYAVKYVQNLIPENKDATVATEVNLCT